MYGGVQWPRGLTTTSRSVQPPPHLPSARTRVVVSHAAMALNLMWKLETRQLEKRSGADWQLGHQETAHSRGHTHSDG